MIVTERQLEDLHKQNGANGHVTLPYRARLTPLASDWVRKRKIVVGFSDAEVSDGGTAAKGGATTGGPAAKETASATGAVLWWCDGPCGPAKAALTAHEKESSLRALELPADANRTASVVKTLASEMKSGRAAAAVLMVRTGAAAIVFANRCPSLRAVLGTCLDAVDQGVRQVAANVLVVEYPHQSLQQMKNMIGRFTRARREPDENVRRQLEELAKCD
jgi:hypothetical protein